MDECEQVISPRLAHGGGDEAHEGRERGDEAGGQGWIPLFTTTLSWHFGYFRQHLSMAFWVLWQYFGHLCSGENTW
jgi:hypothetical protein